MSAAEEGAVTSAGMTVTSGSNNLNYIATSNSKTNPLHAIRCDKVAGMVSDVSVYLNVAHGHDARSEYWFRMVSVDSPIVRAYLSSTDADNDTNHVAESYVGLNTVGRWIFEDAAAADEVWGWFVAEDTSFGYSFQNVVFRCESVDTSYQFLKAVAVAGDQYTFEGIIYLDTSGWEGASLVFSPYITKDDGTKQTFIGGDNGIGFSVDKSILERGGISAYSGVLNIRVVLEIVEPFDGTLYYVIRLDMPEVMGYGGTDYVRSSFATWMLGSIAYLGMDLIMDPGEGGTPAACELISSRLLKRNPVPSPS